MSAAGISFTRLATRAARRYLVGPEQQWRFERPANGWAPQPVERTSFYLHVPFCRHCCPYCPYTKVKYQAALVEPYTRAAIREVDGWADAIGPSEITSIYIGGGTPTLALESVGRILARVRQRFRLVGDICIETNPADVDLETVQRLHDLDVKLVSLGVESFDPANLALLGRGYQPSIAENALSLLTRSSFASVNADIMFALPEQDRAGLTADLAHAAELGADQITTYPLFTFPYTSVGKYRQLAGVRMPRLRVRKEQYQAINRWCAENGYQRVSVWGFKRGDVPRYSSVTRDGYIGVGPGSGSHLSDGFVLNTFDLTSWIEALEGGTSPISLRLPFAGEMGGWWWLYWRFYDTRIPLDGLETMLGHDAPKARRWLNVAERLGFTMRVDGSLELSEAGAFWLHLVQNYFALNYVNTLWTASRQEAWPQSIAI